MNISMDKNKTSELGKALKGVYRGELTVDDSVELAEREISEVFKRRELPPETDTDDGFFGDVVGACPVCSKEIVKGRYGYGCRGYKEGCKFKIGGVICQRVISVTNAKMILETGRSSKIQGFVSKSGKPFDAYLKLVGDKVEFEFDNDRAERPQSQSNAPVGFTNRHIPSSEDLSFLDSITE